MKLSYKIAGSRVNCTIMLKCIIFPTYAHNRKLKNHFPVVLHIDDNKFF